MEICEFAVEHVCNRRSRESRESSESREFLKNKQFSNVMEICEFVDRLKHVSNVVEDVGNIMEHVGNVLEHVGKVMTLTKVARGTRVTRVARVSATLWNMSAT
jgi:hypothetical protein